MKATLYKEQYTFMIICRSFLLRLRNISDRSCRENQITFCVQQPSFFEKKAQFSLDNVENYCTAEQVTDDNMAHAHCILDN
jgi:hypothetical protein